MTPSPEKAENWDDTMQRSIWRLRDKGWTAREIAARFEGVTTEQVRAFIQSGKPPRSPLFATDE